MRNVCSLRITTCSTQCSVPPLHTQFLSKELILHQPFHVKICTPYVHSTYMCISCTQLPNIVFIREDKCICLQMVAPYSVLANTENSTMKCLPKCLTYDSHCRFVKDTAAGHMVLSPPLIPRAQTSYKTMYSIFPMYSNHHLQ